MCGRAVPFRKTPFAIPAATPPSEASPLSNRSSDEGESETHLTSGGRASFSRNASKQKLDFPVSSQEQHEPDSCDVLRGRVLRGCFPVINHETQETAQFIFRLRQVEDVADILRRLSEFLLNLFRHQCNFFSRLLMQQGLRDTLIVCLRISLKLNAI